MLFSSFPYDFPLLWTSDHTPALFYDQLESHLRFMHASPPIVPRILNIAIFIGLAGFMLKLFRPSEANLLFDGASLGLYTVGVVVYVANIVKGLRSVTAASHHDPAPGREDSLRVLAASNAILALVLLGVLVLQTGQWYAERKDQDEERRYEAQLSARAASASHSPGSSFARPSKKKL
jgi:hypothetical protein